MLQAVRVKSNPKRQKQMKKKKSSWEKSKSLGNRCFVCISFTELGQKTHRQEPWKHFPSVETSYSNLQAAAVPIIYSPLEEENIHYLMNSQTNINCRFIFYYVGFILLEVFMIPFYSKSQSGRICITDSYVFKARWTTAISQRILPSIFCIMFAISVWTHSLWGVWYCCWTKFFGLAATFSPTGTAPAIAPGRGIKSSLL